jgi:hypothetical protein
MDSRPNGQLVLALYDRPEIHLLDPFAVKPEPSLAHRFVAGSKILCMTEYIPDQFALLVQGPRDNEDESAQLWTFSPATKNTKQSVQFVGDVAEAASFVALTPLSRTMLLASNSNGAIHRINVSNANETSLFTDPTMSNGIAAIRYNEPELYFVAPVDGIFARFQLNPETGDAVAPVEIIADRMVGVSDFVLASWVDHQAFLVNYEQNSILKVDENAKASTVINGWRAPTTATFGGTYKDKRTLYVGTGGTLGLMGMVMAINV